MSITRFGNNVSHVLLNKDVCARPVVFQAQAAVQCRLHSIDPEIFPLLEATDIPVSIFQGMITGFRSQGWSGMEGNTVNFFWRHFEHFSVPMQGYSSSNITLSQDFSLENQRIGGIVHVLSLKWIFLLFHWLKFAYFFRTVCKFYIFFNSSNL